GARIVRYGTRCRLSRYQTSHLMCLENIGPLHASICEGRGPSEISTQRSRPVFGVPNCGRAPTNGSGLMDSPSERANAARGEATSAIDAAFKLSHSGKLDGRLADDRRARGMCLGAGLRHLRTAGALNLDDAPPERIQREVEKAVDCIGPIL